MSDTAFDIAIAQIDQAAEAAKAAKPKPLPEPPVAPLPTPGDIAHLRPRLSPQSRAGKIQNFQRSFGENVVSYGLTKKGWSRNDLVLAGQLAAYLTSVETTEPPSERPRQPVYDVTITFFRRMVEEGTGLPQGTFQGERMLSAKKVGHVAVRSAQAPKPYATFGAYRSSMASAS